MEHDDCARLTRVPSPTYALSLSSESDLDSTILSPLVAESVLAFTSAPTRTERPLAQQFEDIDSLATESVNNESQMSTVLSTGIQEPAVVQHSTHYMHTNMVVFQVSNTLYRVPVYAFVHQSEHFKSLLHEHIGDSGGGTATHPIEDPGPIHLDDDDVENVDFERLLSIIYPLVVGEYAATTLEEWSSILHLSMKWGFTSISAIAAREVFLLASAVDRIVLGRKYDFDSWLLDAFVEVCERSDALSLLEACRMRVEDIVRISQAREEIHAPSVRLHITQIQAIVTQIFGLHDDRSTSEDTADSAQIQATGNFNLPTLANGNNFIIDDELVLRLSIPIRRIQVHTGWVVGGRPMQITYAPTFRGAQWVKCHGDSTSKGDSMAMAMYYTLPVTWNSWPAVALLFAYTAATFTIYTFAPLLYRKASTACYNLSLLFPEFNGLLPRLSLHHYSTYWLDLVAFAIIIAGLVFHFWSVTPEEQGGLQPEALICKLLWKLGIKRSRPAEVAGEPEPEGDRAETVRV